METKNRKSLLEKTAFIISKNKNIQHVLSGNLMHFLKCIQPPLTIALREPIVTSYTLIDNIIVDAVSLFLS